MTSNITIKPAFKIWQLVWIYGLEQVDYILGNNPLKISYMAGFGPKFPQRLHHRGASLPSIHVKPEKISCNEGMSNWYNANLANPNIHVGAVVGGPDSNDQFTDAISSYKQGEPTTYMNAGMVGALAGLVRWTRGDKAKWDCVACLRVWSLIRVSYLSIHSSTGISYNTW